MTDGQSTALYYMNKALKILELEPASPSVCHLQMAVDLLTEDHVTSSTPMIGSAQGAQPAQLPLSANARA